MKLLKLIVSLSFFGVILGSPVFASTVSTIRFDWIGGNQTLGGDVLTYPGYGGNPLEIGPYNASFVFEADNFSSSSFNYSGYFPSNIETAMKNPYNATLISRPDQFGYAYGEYHLSFKNGRVFISANLFNLDDILQLGSNFINIDRNQGLVIYGSSGYWSASVNNTIVASSQAAVVPLPSSIFLLLLGGLSFLFLGRRKSRQIVNLYGGAA